jgi:tetratricopeptide (TPR) repeat protein
VGQGIAGMPLPYDVKRVLDATDVYQTNADTYAAHTNEFWQKAIDAYTAAIQQDELYANAYNLRGIARQRIRPADSAGAEQDFARAIALGERHYGVYWNYGIALYNDGKFKDAEDAARVAMELNPGICGPAYTVSLAVLAQGDLDRAGELYEQATAQCDKIYHDALARKEQPPASLWGSMETAADDLDNYLCALASRQCYPNRTFPKLGTVSNLNSVVTRAEALRKHVKEALTKLEFQGTTTVTPTGASFAPIQFGYYIINPDGSDQFLSYAEKDIFPYNEFSPAIEMWTASSCRQVLSKFRHARS